MKVHGLFLTAIILSLSCASNMKTNSGNLSHKGLITPYENIHCLYDLDKIKGVVRSPDTTCYKINGDYEHTSLIAFPLIDEEGNLVDVKFNKKINAQIDSLALQVIKNSKFNKLQYGDNCIKYCCLLVFTFEDHLIKCTLDRNFQGDSPKNDSNTPQVPYFGEPPEPIGGFAEVQRNLRFPQSAKDARLAGKIMISVFIDEDGNIGPYKTIQSASDDFSLAAYQALKSVKWKPAKCSSNKTPCHVWISIPFIFKL